MAQKYCYIIVNVENGNMLLEDKKLPIYWNKKVAQERLKQYATKKTKNWNGLRFCVGKIELKSLEKLILGCKIIYQ